MPCQDSTISLWLDRTDSLSNLEAASPIKQAELFQTKTKTKSITDTKKQSEPESRLKLC